MAGLVGRRAPAAAFRGIGDDLARDRWASLSPGARKAYGLRSDPGGPIAAQTGQSHLPPDQQARQFIVIIVSLEAVDVLRLDAEGGQTRACARFTPDGLEARWIGA